MIRVIFLLILTSMFSIGVAQQILETDHKQTYWSISEGFNNKLYTVGAYGNIHFIDLWTDTIGEERKVSSSQLYDIHFVSELKGWAVGEYNTIAKTNNGGESWSSRTETSGRWLTSISFMDEDNGIAVGYHGVIFRTSNEGLTWTISDSIVDSDLRSIIYHDNKYFSIGSNGYVIQSDDGIEWSSNQLDSHYFRAIEANDNSLMIVGDDGVIYYSSDNGLNWEEKSSGTNENLLSVKYNNGSSWIAVGSNGTVLRTDDNGNTWNSILVSSSSLLTDLYIKDDILFIVGSEGTIIKLYPDALGVQGKIGKEDVLYPNPTSKEILFDYTDIESVYIIDLNGRIIKTIYRPFGVINVEDLETGLYHVVLQYNNGLKGYKRFIKDDITH